MINALHVARQGLITSTMREVQWQHGRYDILVNNAGIHPKRDGGKFTAFEVEKNRRDSDAGRGRLAL